MPRPKKVGAPEPKRRSRNGCWPCKARKVKCGEERPRCQNCEKQGETCDYSIRLNWGGRTKKSRDDAAAQEVRTGTASPHFSTFAAAAEEAITGQRTGSTTPKFFEFTGLKGHNRSRSMNSILGSDHGSRHSSPLPREHSFTSAAPPTSHPTNSMPMDPRLQTMQFSLNTTDYPSPMESPGGGHMLGHPPRSSPIPGAMPPPFVRSISSPTSMAAPLGSPVGLASFMPEPELPPVSANKRLKLSPQDEMGNGLFSGRAEIIPIQGPACLRDIFSSMPGAAPLTPFSEFAPTPRTSASSADSDDIARSVAPMTHIPHEPRRLSIIELLVEDNYNEHQDLSGFQNNSRQYPVSNAEEGFIQHGYDIGLPDLDTPKNDDLNAIRVFSPLPNYRATLFGSNYQAESNFAIKKDIAFEPGGYYADPVPIKISKDLEPLPARLLENPMNLLYFHHFLNHTARILVPNDCDENPFRTILPRMAIRDENLLNILLAYSASHRAHLLNHSLPSSRIANYVENVFPCLRKSLETSDISISTLTTAIMLASLEIVAPNTFGVYIPWRVHLNIGRQMIIARGPQPIHREDKALFFLSRWFAYLDVIGSLSNCKTESPVAAGYWTNTPSTSEEEDDHQIDCLLGFTGRFIGILGKIAELVKRVEAQRFQEDGTIASKWKPSPDIVAAAEELKVRIREGREHVVKGCPHRRKSSTSSIGWYNPQECADSWDALQLFSANEAFHWAAYIHLTQRVLGRPKEDSDVQNAVKQIVGALYKVKRGGSAEACLLFPMFTAGVYAVDEKVRERIMERVGGCEGFGMAHVTKARNLMQNVWDTGKPWESMADDEFFG